MKPYRRRLSREDAATRTLLITKDRWRDFPPPMREFTVDAGGAQFATRIVAEDCACVAPRHQHLHLEAGHFSHQLDFQTGVLVEIRREGDTYVVRNG